MKGLIKIILNNIPRPILIRLSYIFRIFSKILYKGNKVHCPVCGSSFKKFMPYGYENVRNNALCPNCLSLERHRVIWLYLQRETNFFTDNIKILHIAPEQSFLKRFKKLENLEYVTADLESPIADYKCDVQKMPFKENEFDMVMCNHVMEHVDDDYRAMSEVLRVLKPGGKAILLVPQDFSLEETYEDSSITDSSERRKHFGQYDHKRLYGKDYPERLKKVGFIVPDVNFIDTLSEEEIEKYCLMKEEFMFGYEKVVE